MDDNGINDDVDSDSPLDNGQEFSINSNQCQIAEISSTIKDSSQGVNSSLNLANDKMGEVSDSLTRDTVIKRAAATARIPWRTAEDAFLAIICHQAEVVTYLKLKVGLDQEHFGRLMMKALLADDRPGQFKLTKESVSDWTIDSSVSYELGKPVYRLPPHLMRLLKDFCYGIYGDMTVGWKDEQDRYLKENKHLCPDEMAKKLYYRTQKSRVYHWFKDQMAKNKKATLVSTYLPHS